MNRLARSVLTMTAAVMLSAAVQSAAADVPAWLGGTPDTTPHGNRCALYRWLFEEADRQTGGRAGNDRLAKDRLVNIANKLTAHHRASPQDAYAADVRYLVMGEQGPAHFQLRIDRETLRQLLDQGCGK